MALGNPIVRHKNTPNIAITYALKTHVNHVEPQYSTEDDWSWNYGSMITKL